MKLIPSIRYGLSVVLVILLLNTGAMAESALQKNDAGFCVDKTAGLMWQITKSKQFKKLADVQAYVAGLTLGGYSDWRLPTTLEGGDLRGVIAIQGDDDCKIPRLGRSYWLEDKKDGTVPAKLELECFCRGDFNLIVKKKGAVRVVRNINPVK
jgi:hypothetical protein